MTWTMRKRRRLAYNGQSQLKYSESVISDYFTGQVVAQSHFNSPFTLSTFRLQETVDVDRKVHPRNKDSRDDGGPFFSKKLEIAFTPVPCSARLDYRRDYWTRVQQSLVGNATIVSSETDNLLLMNPTAINALWASISVPSEDLSVYGSKAFNRLDPTRRIKGVPSVARSIAELVREGLPRIPRQLLKRVRARISDVGDEYLNVAFGWLPLLSDIRDLLKLYQDLERRLAQLRRDNGHSVRRKGKLYHDKSVSERVPLAGNPQILIYPGNGFYNVSADSGQQVGPNESWTESETTVWFSGKGSYILPVDLQFPGHKKIDDCINLLKAVPSPADVYQLIPWTWLIAWFSSLGDLVEQAIGHGVGTYTADYCYVMRKHVERTYYVCNNVDRYGLQNGVTGERIPGPSLRTAQCVVTKTTLERAAATPFGFGLTLGDLNSSQWAILTALGLSRLNF